MNSVTSSEAIGTSTAEKPCKNQLSTRQMKPMYG